ncbi:MAG: Holliday junction resolvase RuvX [Candidatus Peregrinibacteria bacterium]
MTKILLFDIGKRRTGVAFFDDHVGVPLPLNTLQHHSIDEQIQVLMASITERKPDRIVFGLPRLLSGEEGSQAAFVRSIAKKLEEQGIVIEFTDERYSNDAEMRGDPDAYAAWNLLQSLPLQCILQKPRNS